MPGSNCAIFGCTVSRRKNYKGISLFSIPSASDERKATWRREIINIITKYRVLDKKFRKQIDEGKVHVCERHFQPRDIEVHNSRKTLLFGALPLLNLPEKSHPSSIKPVTSEPAFGLRSGHVRIEENVCPIECKPYFNTLSEYKAHLVTLKLTGWTVDSRDDKVVFSWFDGAHNVAKFEVTIDCSLGFSVSVYGWCIPDDHSIYCEHRRSVRFTRPFPMLSSIANYNICSGLSCVKDSDVRDPIENERSRLMRHSIQKVVDPLDFDTSPAMVVTVFKRHEHCIVLISETPQCCACKGADDAKIKADRQAAKKNLEPIKDRAPLSATSHERLALALKTKRVECKKLKDQLAKLEAAVYNNNCGVVRVVHLEHNYSLMEMDANDQDVNGQDTNDQSVNDLDTNEQGANEQEDIIDQDTNDQSVNDQETNDQSADGQEDIIDQDTNYQDVKDEQMSD